MRKIHGVGINDLNHQVCWVENGVRKMCPYYRRWTGMLERCYSKKFHVRHPSYKDCEVTKDWHLFSNFKSWMETQEWQNKELDKDLLVQGNKLYSPNTCVFIESNLNLFLNERGAKRGEYPLGVSFDKRLKKFRAMCRVNGKNFFLGRFDTVEEAHTAWKSKKLELAKEIATKQSDPRIAKAIVARYQ